MALGAFISARPKKKRQPLTIGGAPKAPSAPSAPRWGTAAGALALTDAWKKANQPRFGTKAGEDALRAAWAQANPGQALPEQAPRWGTEAGNKALTEAWQAANPGQTLSAPASGESGGGGGKAASKVGPLADDAQAAAARAQAIFDATQKRAALRASSAIESADLEEAIRRMRGQRPDDERNAKSAANNAGLFYSGALVKQMGDIGTDYVRREGDQRTVFDRSEAARRAQLAEVDQTETLASAAIDAALAEREARRAAERAEAGTLAGPDGTDETPASSAPASAAPAPAPRIGTPAGAEALMAAWQAANPGQTFPTTPAPATAPEPRIGTLAGRKALIAAWKKANPGKAVPKSMRI